MRNKFMIPLDLINKYKRAPKKLLVLDYDGTLVNFRSTPTDAIPDQNLINTLSRLLEDPSIEPIIISGRKHQEIDKLIGHLPITIIAEHGAMIRESRIWKNQWTGDISWKHEVAHLMNELAVNCPGSFVENKNFSMSWHYRNLDEESGHRYSRELISRLHNFSNGYKLRIMDGHKVVEIMNEEINKGTALQFFIENKNNRYDYIICIGDDITDEDMFRYLLPYDYAITIKIGTEDSYAKYRLESVQKVLLLLNELTSPV